MKKKVKMKWTGEKLVNYQEFSITHHFISFGFFEFSVTDGNASRDGQKWIFVFVFNGPQRQLLRFHKLKTFSGRKCKNLRAKRFSGVHWPVNIFITTPAATYVHIYFRYSDVRSNLLLSWPYNQSMFFEPVAEEN